MPYIVLVTRDRLCCKRTFFCIIALLVDSFVTRALAGRYPDKQTRSAD